MRHLIYPFPGCSYDYPDLELSLGSRRPTGSDSARARAIEKASGCSAKPKSRQDARERQRER